MGCAARSRQGLVESLSSRYHACRTESTPPVFGGSGISHDVCHVLFIHVRSLLTVLSHACHIHMSHRTSHTIPYRIDHKTRANTTPDPLVHYSKAHAKAVPYITALYNALSLQYSEHSGQTREKQKPKAKGEAWPWSSRRRSWQLQLAAQTGDI